MDGSTRPASRPVPASGSLLEVKLTNGVVAALIPGQERVVTGMIRGTFPEAAGVRAWRDGDDVVFFAAASHALLRIKYHYLLQQQAEARGDDDDGPDVAVGQAAPRLAADAGLETGTEVDNDSLTGNAAGSGDALLASLPSGSLSGGAGAAVGSGLGEDGALAAGLGGVNAGLIAGLADGPAGLADIGGGGGAGGDAAGAGAGAGTGGAGGGGGGGGGGSTGGPRTTTSGDVTTTTYPDGSVLIVAGNGNDVLTGTDLNDTIIAGNGNDTISAGGGDDVIVTGDGNSSIDGGDGNDRITTGNGNNTINGGAGNDTITAGNGNNLVDGGAGDDLIGVGNGNNTVTGGAGNDTITAGSGSNLLIGGAGNDSISATGPGRNTIDGGDGNDTLQGGSGSDSIQGGPGDDLIYASGGNDTIDGGGGSDTLDFSLAPHAVTVSLDGTIRAGDDNGFGGQDLVTSIERAVGTGGNDHFRGVGDGVTIDGGAGIDTVDTLANASVTVLNVESVAGAGSGDVLTLGTAGTIRVSGENTIRGSAGDDDVILTAPMSAGLVDLAGGTDTLTLANGGNTLSVGNTELITGGSGDDDVTLTTAGTYRIDLAAGTDTLHLAAGDSHISAANIESIVGTAGNDVVDLLTVASGTHVDFGTGANQLTLAAGANLLTVTGSADVTGSTGADHVTFGSGAQTFHFDEGGGGAGLDVVTGFASGADHLHIDGLTGVAYDNAALVLLAGQTAAGADRTLTIDGTDSITVQGIGRNLTPGDLGVTISEQFQLAGGASAPEGTDLLFTVNRTGTPFGDAYVAYHLVPGTATASHYSDAGAGSLHFADGQTSATITVHTTDDHAWDNYGNGLTMGVVLDGTSDGTLGGTTTATGTLTEVTPVPTVSLAASASIAENGGRVTYTASLDHATDHDVTVTIHSQAGLNATQGADYADGGSPDYTATILAGTTSATVAGGMAINNAIQDLVAGRQIDAHITGATGGVTVDGTVQHTAIADDDVAHLAITALGNVSEGGTAQWQITTDIAHADAITVDYNTIQNLAGGAGLNAATGHGVLTLGAGLTSGSVSVATGSNGWYDYAGKSVALHVNSMSSGVVGSGQNAADGVSDVDGPATVTIGAQTVGAGAVAGVYVSLNHGSDYQITGTTGTYDGSAVNGVNYSGGTASWAIGPVAGPGSYHVFDIQTLDDGQGSAHGDTVYGLQELALTNAINGGNGSGTVVQPASTPYTITFHFEGPSGTDTNYQLQGFSGAPYDTVHVTADVSGGTGLGSLDVQVTQDLPVDIQGTDGSNPQQVFNTHFSFSGNGHYDLGTFTSGLVASPATGLNDYGSDPEPLTFHLTNGNNIAAATGSYGGMWDPSYPPVVIDLTGAGIHLTSAAESGALVDWTGNGKPMASGWFGAGNGLLAIDANGDGQITAVDTELARGMRGPDGKPMTDMEALAANYDSNHDGKLDASDAAWSQFRVWADNGDGAVQAGEVETLDQLGVASIDLTGARQPTLDHGNVVFRTTDVTWTDGHTTMAADVAFAAHPATLDHQPPSTILFGADGTPLAATQAAPDAPFSPAAASPAPILVDLGGAGFGAAAPGAIAWAGGAGRTPPDALSGLLGIQLGPDGSVTPLQALLPKAGPAGFAAVATLFDSNHDGVLDRHDVRWEDFRVVAGPHGTAYGLDQLGIKAIALGDGTHPDATVRWADGRTTAAVEAPAAAAAVAHPGDTAVAFAVAAPAAAMPVVGVSLPDIHVVHHG